LEGTECGTERKALLDIWAVLYCEIMLDIWAVLYCEIMLDIRAHLYCEIMLDIRAHLYCETLFLIGKGSRSVIQRSVFLDPASEL
jgi:hypothetical protein